MSKKSNAPRKDGRYCVQVYLGRDDNGKRLYKVVYGATQKEADKKADEIRNKKNIGIKVIESKDSFKKWLDIVVEQKKTCTDKWYKSYVTFSKKLEPLYDIPLEEVQQLQLQQVLNNLANENYSKKTIKLVKQIADQTFKLAISNRVIQFNPADNVTLPKTKEQETRRALTEEEQGWIINTPHRCQTSAMIMLFAGLRRGELFALTWNDINLTDGTITVNKSVEMVNGQPVLKQGAKTESGTRTIFIPALLVDYLRTKQSVGLVVSMKNGKIMSDSAWKRLWSSYMTDLNIKYGDFSLFKDKPKSKYDPAGVPFVISHFTAHWLRHTFATMLYLSGVDVLTAKEQLGHSDIKTTLGIYTHLDNEHRHKSINQLNEYIKNKVQVNMHVK